MSDRIIIDLTPPDDSATKEELDLYLSNSITSFREIQKRRNRKGWIAFVCILLSTAISSKVIQSSEVVIINTGLKVDVLVASPLLLFIAALLILLATFDKFGVVLFAEKIDQLYKARFGTTSPIWCLFSPSAGNIINRLGYLGWYGQLSRFVFIAAMTTPIAIIAFNSTEMTKNFPDIKSILFHISFTLILIAGLVEFFTTKITPKLINKLR